MSVTTILAFGTLRGARVAMCRPAEWFRPQVMLTCSAEQGRFRCHDLSERTGLIFSYNLVLSNPRNQNADRDFRVGIAHLGPERASP